MLLPPFRLTHISSNNNLNNRNSHNTSSSSNNSSIPRLRRNPREISRLLQVDRSLRAIAALSMEEITVSRTGTPMLC